MSDNDAIWSADYVAACKEIDRLRAENARSSDDIRSYRHQQSEYRKTIDSLRSQLDALQRRCEGLEKALMFYRDQWQPDYIGDPDVAMRLFSEPTEALLRDEGKIAARVLSQELRDVLLAALAGETGKATPPTQ